MATQSKNMVKKKIMTFTLTGFYVKSVNPEVRNIDMKVNITKFK